MKLCERVSIVLGLEVSAFTGGEGGNGFIVYDVFMSACVRLSSWPSPQDIDIRASALGGNSGSQGTLAPVVLNCLSN